MNVLYDTPIVLVIMKFIVCKRLPTRVHRTLRPHCGGSTNNNLFEKRWALEGIMRVHKIMSWHVGRPEGLQAIQERGDDEEAVWEKDIWK